MANRLMLLLGAAFGAVLGASIFFLLYQRERFHIWKYPRSHRRQSTESKIPPLPWSPVKQTPSHVEVDYLATFPPSRCFALTDIASPFTPDGDSLKHLKPPLAWIKEMLPMDKSYLDADDSMHTPCGFSVKQIRALGDFPDYATLSGVPLPKPYLNFDINKALPRPYRPFRWAYHQTMALTKMEPDWFLELENTYVERIRQRQALFAKHGQGVLQALPGSELACKELMEVSLQFLCARYPQYFRMDMELMTLHNAILKTQTNLKTTHPLHVLLDNIPEDFAIMQRDDKTGFYRFRAGLLCSSLGWNLASKIDLRLHEIHAPIPDYKEKMQFSMDRYFAKKPTDKPIQRGSWGLEVDQPLHMPPGDPHEKHRDFQAPELTLDRCHLRVDWQTLRRLPLSGGVAFNFKALFTPVTEFRDEPCIPGLILKVLNDGKEGLLKYKNHWHVEHVVKPALEQYHQEQKQKGLIPGDWEPRTLEESPYFPGWEEKWHRQQGF